MSQHEPEATPEQQEAVRRLLAEARHDAPLPPEVASRLDAVLAGLAAEGPRAVDPPPPPPGAGTVVVDLAARRRRRVVALLGAAAAVVVLGVGVSQVVDGVGPTSGSDDSADAPAAADAPEREDSADNDGAAQPSEPEAPGDATSPPTYASPLPEAQEEVPQVAEDTFAQMVATLRLAPGVESSAGESFDGGDLSRSSMFVCEPAEFGEGRLLAVEYDGVPAVLAYRPPAGKSQTVELLRCGTGDVIRSTVLPVG